MLSSTACKRGKKYADRWSEVVGFYYVTRINDQPTACREMTGLCVGVERGELMFGYLARGDAVGRIERSSRKLMKEVGGCGWG